MQFCTLSYSCIETSFHCTHLWDGMLDARRSYHSHTKCGRKMPINHARSISRVLSVCPKRQQLFSSIVQKRCANASCGRVQNVENSVCLNTSTQRPHATHQFIAHTHYMFMRNGRIDKVHSDTDLYDWRTRARWCNHARRSRLRCGRGIEMRTRNARSNYVLFNYTAEDWWTRNPLCAIIEKFYYQWLLWATLWFTHFILYNVFKSFKKNLFRV